MLGSYSREVSHSGQLHTPGKREPSGYVGSNPTTSAMKNALWHFSWWTGAGRCPQDNPAGKRTAKGSEHAQCSEAATTSATENPNCMKIYVLGSTSFMHEMVQTKNDLVSAGLDGWIHPDYEAFVRGEKQSILEKAKTEHAAVKRDNNYLKVHYAHILASDAVLIVNGEKNGIKNYIGGNVLIEMGQAYVNDKLIFLLHGIPLEVPYTAEIECMDPVCLHGDIRKIKNL